MMKQKEKDREKEKNEKLKALRRELEEKIEEQLPSEPMDEEIRVEVQKINEGEELEPARAKQVIEALLFAASKPMTSSDIRKVMKYLSVGQVVKFIKELQGEYEQAGRSFEIVEIANGYEMATRKDFAPWIMKVELQKRAKQVTQSALETLSILAYKQPITRAEIEELRGVDASGVVSTLTERGLIKIVGKKEVPGRPFLYGTTEKFLEHFGLNTLKDLPNIEEIRALVETSVKRDELIGTTHIVAIPTEEDVLNEEVLQQTPAEELSGDSALLEEVESSERLESHEVNSSEQEEIQEAAAEERNS